VVLAILGAGAVVLLPRLSLWDDQARLGAAGRMVAGAAGLARSEAVTRAAPVWLRLGQGYVQVGAAGAELWSGRLPAGVGLARVLVKGRPAGEEQVILFQSDGRASEAAIYLLAGEKRVTLHLEPLTGRLSAQAGWVGYDWTH
jgi:Tfp pilus assembly protein FimT